MTHLEHRMYPEDQYRSKGVLGAWNILLDAHNAVLYGFIQCRMPEPGRQIDVDEAEAHVVRIEKEWEAERSRRDLTGQWTGAPPFTAIPLDAKLYLHSVLVDERAVESETVYERGPLDR